MSLNSSLYRGLGHRPLKSVTLDAANGGYLVRLDSHLNREYDYD